MSSPERGVAYTPEEAAEFLRTSGTALRAAAWRKQIPHTRVGRYVRFTADDIAEILAAGQRPAAEQKAATPAPRRSPRRLQPTPPSDVTALRPRPEAARRRGGSA